MMVCTLWLGIWALHWGLHGAAVGGGMATVDVAISLLLVADMIVCARTCFVRNNGLVDDPAQVRRHYLLTWFVPDL
eukprot:gene27771-57555_t